MAETVFLSPGVYDRESEILPRNQGPVGTPGGALGSSLLGPAFVPVTVGNFNQFTRIFGDNIDGERQGVIAAREFLRNGTAFTYCRVLGAGAGGSVSSVNVDTTSVSYFEGAGFIAGNEKLNGVSSADVSGSWNSGSNFWVIGHAVQDVDLSSLYLEGLIEGAGTPLSSSIALSGSSRASGVLQRATVLTSGSAQVYLYSGSTASSGLAGSGASLSSASLGTPGGLVGAISPDSDVVSRQQFVLSVGTTANPDQFFGPITCSMDPSRGDYFANILNRDPELFSERGHILYSRYDVDPTVVTMSGSDVLTLGDRYLSGVSGASFVAKAYSSGTVGAVRKDNFGSRFRAPISSYVISQAIGGEEIELFKVESLHDGHLPSTTFKISIANITKPNVTSADPYGTFSLLVRAFGDTDQNPVILEQYNNCNLNPNSDNFICRKIGTQKTYFDFNQADEEDRKLVTDGDFETQSNYIRLVPTVRLVDGRVPKSALPFGFSGPSVQADPVELASTGTIVGQSVPPIPFRQTIARGVHSTSRSRRRDLGLYWGVQFQGVEVPSSGKGQDDPNSSRTINSGIDGFTRLYGVVGNETMVTGSFGDQWAGTNINADTFNRNKFTLDNVALMSDLNVGYTTSNMTSTTLADAKFYRYFRGGVPAGTASLGDLLNLSGDSSAASYNRVASTAKFSFYVGHGFDGTNIQNRESSLLSNIAVRDAENNASLPGGLLDNTVNAYLHGIQIMSNKDDVAINLFAIPGIKQPIVTDRAIDAIENNFDALYIMDVDDRLGSNPETISSVGDVLATVEARSLDSSFAAAFYPDVVVADAAFGRRTTIAPSSVVLGAFAFNDRVSNPFQATAGFNRGVLETVVGTTQRLSQQDRDDVYSRGNINPIFQPPGRPFVIFGNKTLDGNNDSALTRINTRRLLIEIRRAVRRAAESVLFDQNNQAALDRLNQLINPILERIQAQGGLTQYRVVIDGTTTGQAERENNTVAGKIFIQPTTAIEVISLDFTIDQSGVTFA